MKLEVLCVTWNLHEKVPTADQLGFLNLDDYDIVAFGTQECERSISVCHL